MYFEADFSRCAENSVHFKGAPSWDSPLIGDLWHSDGAPPPAPPPPLAAKPGGGLPPAAPPAPSAPLQPSGQGHIMISYQWGHQKMLMQVRLLMDIRAWVPGCVGIDACPWINPHTHVCRLRVHVQRYVGSLRAVLKDCLCLCLCLCLSVSVSVMYTAHTNAHTQTHTHTHTHITHTHTHYLCACRHCFTPLFS